LLAWLQGEPAAAIVQEHLDRAERDRSPCLISLINLGEIHYCLARLNRRDEADRFWRDAVRGVLPVRVILATVPRVRRAAGWKSRFAVAYADAFAVATAVEFRAALVTGDPEIRQLEKDKDAPPIIWLPQAGRR
jgi:predicted nucleic acid-binding protein